MINCIFIPERGPVQHYQLDQTQVVQSILEALKCTYFDVVRVQSFGIDLELIVDDCGLLTERPRNMLASWIYGHTIVGPALLCADCDTGDGRDICDMPLGYLETIKKMINAVGGYDDLTEINLLGGSNDGME